MPQSHNRNRLPCRYSPAVLAPVSPEGFGTTNVNATNRHASILPETMRSPTEDLMEAFINNVWISVLIVVDVATYS